MQGGLLNEASLSALHEGHRLLANIRQLIKASRDAGHTIIYTQYSGPDGQPPEQGTPDWNIHPDISPHETDTIIQKSTSSAFDGTELSGILHQGKIETLIICGLQSEFCVASTGLDALRLGYKVIVAQNCHSTFPSEKCTARAMVEQQNERLKKQGVAVKPSVDAIFPAATHSNSPAARSSQRHK